MSGPIDPDEVFGEFEPVGQPGYPPEGPMPFARTSAGVTWLEPVLWSGIGSPPAPGDTDATTPASGDIEEDGIPASLLAAMTTLRHRGALATDDPDRLRWASAPVEPAARDRVVDPDRPEGGGRPAPPDIVYAIDDGREHCMVARMVGRGDDGTDYCLVARTLRLDIEEARHGWRSPAAIFELAREFCLCGVAGGPFANVAVVDRWRKYVRVPPEYLPGTPPIGFTDPA